MRGCLSVLVIAAAFILAVVWFGGPSLAATVVEAGLTGSGFAADDLHVNVRADPPLELALGQADGVDIVATGVRWEGLRAGSMTMHLDGVDLVGRTAKTADGQFRDVEVPVSGDAPAQIDIGMLGPADDAATTITIDEASVNRLALAAFAQQFGTRPDSVVLKAPDRIGVRLGGNELNGTLSVDAGGGLLVSTVLGGVRLVEPSTIPFQLTGLSVDPSGLELTGSIDLGSLLR